MMKLSVMLKVDSVIDAEGRSRIAERLLERWEHVPGSARFFRSSANFVYAFHRGGKRFFLRFADSAERSEAEIAAELALLQWVASQGMSVATPIASNSGEWMETVDTDLGTFHAVVFAELPGSELEIDELSATQFERWGVTLGNLHAVMRRYHGAEASVRRTWRDDLDMIRRFIPAGEQRVQTEYEFLAAWLAALPVTETNYGLIHGDFELDNLFWQDETVAMLDFDDCSSNWFAADVAYALRDLFVAGVDLSDPSLRAFIRGYARHSELDEESVSQLPTWLRLVNLTVYAKLMRAMDLDAEQAYPDWCIAAQSNLERWVSNYKASLLAIPA
jgi:Ser/Thr protein kinase RdoA (MazF antagonist)